MSPLKKVDDVTPMPWIKKSSTEESRPFLDILFVARGAASTLLETSDAKSSPLESNICSPKVEPSSISRHLILVKETGQSRLSWSPFRKRPMDPQSTGLPEAHRTEAGSYACHLLGLLGKRESDSTGVSQTSKDWEECVKDRVKHLPTTNYSDIRMPDIKVADKDQKGSTFKLTFWRPITEHDMLWKQEEHPAPWSSCPTGSDERVSSVVDEDDAASQCDTIFFGEETPRLGSLTPAQSQEPRLASEGHDIEPEDEPGLGDCIDINVSYDPGENRFSYTVTDDDRPVPEGSRGPGTRAHEIARDMLATLNSGRICSQASITAAFDTCRERWLDGRYQVWSPTWLGSVERSVEPSTEQPGSVGVSPDLSFRMICARDYVPDTDSVG